MTFTRFKFHATECATVLTGVSMLVGCKNAANVAAHAYPTSAPVLEEHVDIRPLPTTRPGLMAVTSGKLPLVYFVQSPAAIQVTDITSHEILASADCPSSTIVHLDAVKGVVYGRAILRSGPLPTDHTYEIELIPDQSPGEFRTGTIAPGGQ